MVFPVPPPGYGGLENVVGDLSECLGRLGHEVYVLCPGGSEAGEHYKVLTPVDASPSNPEDMAYEAVRPSLFDYDLVHSHGWAGYPYLAAREHPGRLKVLQTLHGPLQFGTKPVDKPCFVAASQAHARFLRRQMGFECRVVYHGIDLERHRPGTEKGNYLLFLARVAPEKGALEFVDLCREVKMSGLLVGDDVFPPDQDYVRRTMRACEDSGGLVRYMGPAGQAWKVELLQEARCLVTPVQPPYIEIFGLSTVEGMACGTPVLSTDLGAAKELILEGETGAVVANTDGLVEGLEKALKCEPAACRRRAEAFPRERMAQEYAELYERMLAGEEW